MTKWHLTPEQAQSSGTPYKGTNDFHGAYSATACSSEEELTRTQCTASTQQTGKLSGLTRLNRRLLRNRTCAVAYGMVYEMNKDGILYAINMENGDFVWKYIGPDNTLLWPGMPSVADGKVYVTTGETAMYGGASRRLPVCMLKRLHGTSHLDATNRSLSAKRISRIIAYGNLYMIPGNVTTSVDSVSGNEYSRINEVWAIGSNSDPSKQLAHVER